MAFDPATLAAAATGGQNLLFGQGSGKSVGSGGTSYDLGLDPAYNLHQRQTLGGSIFNQIYDQGTRLGNLRDQLSGYQQQAAGSAPTLGANFQRASLNTQSFIPQFGQGLDQTSQQLISQELGNRQAQAARQQQQIAQQFRNNPGLARILGFQNQASNALANNPLAFTAQQAQTGRQIQEAGAQQQGQAALNQALLQATGSANEQQTLQNQAALAQQQARLAGLGAASQFGQQQAGLGQQIIGNLGTGIDFLAPKSSAQQEKKTGGLFGLFG